MAPSELQTEAAENPVSVLSMAYADRCDKDMNACNANKFGTNMDKRYIKCAMKIEPQLIWFNTLAIQRTPRAHKKAHGIGDVALAIAGMDWTGLPVKVPWLPVVVGESGHDLNTDSFIPVPHRFLPTLRNHSHLGGFTREEGTQFVPLLKAYVPELEHDDVYYPKDWRHAIESIMCFYLKPTGRGKDADRQQCVKRRNEIETAYLPPSMLEWVAAHEENETMLDYASGKKFQQLEENLAGAKVLRHFISAMLGDYLFGCSTRRGAELMIAPDHNGRPQNTVRMFRFDREPPFRRLGSLIDGIAGTAHTFNMLYLYHLGTIGGNMHDVLKKVLLTWTDDDERMTNAMQETLRGLADELVYPERDKPGILNVWQTFDKPNMPVMVLGEDKVERAENRGEHNSSADEAWQRYISELRPSSFVFSADPPKEVPLEYARSMFYPSHAPGAEVVSRCQLMDKIRNEEEWLWDEA
eukprot:gnl/TRDRNA2_/TRDRNA2_175571_c0_seq1.p2 gnl/TRDRNA2_/TRDRNA2_175571_c0~~gnl/TRDRNA2_/TRDRNA2_175571_c0_seq1.p2  ORF type:complete len:468 (+),score=72.28 gnl/TRDRNA2_/TRDRNA2_175571_c0_seq1:1613-3016(+)